MDGTYTDEDPSNSNTNNQITTFNSFKSQSIDFLTLFKVAAKKSVKYYVQMELRFQIDRISQQHAGIHHF